MAEINSLSVESREISGKGSARAIRREGKIPGIIYGDDQKPVLISMDPKDLLAEINKPGFSSKIFEISINDKKYRTMAQDVQIHNINNKPIHVDFRKISKTTIVNVNIEVRFTNNEDSPGLKKGGVLNTVRHEIEVKSKPDDLPSSIEVDLTGTEIGDSIHISSVKLPNGVSPKITDRDFTICTIAPPTVVSTTEDETDEDEITEEENKEESKEETKE